MLRDINDGARSGGLEKLSLFIIQPKTEVRKAIRMAQERAEAEDNLWLDYGVDYPAGTCDPNSRISVHTGIRRSTDREAQGTGIYGTWGVGIYLESMDVSGRNDIFSASITVRHYLEDAIDSYDPADELQRLGEDLKQGLVDAGVEQLIQEIGQSRVASFGYRINKGSEMATNISPTLRFSMCPFTTVEQLAEIFYQCNPLVRYGRQSETQAEEAPGQ
jgi:hypothetical protein